jgi:PPOX class probable F420-dependent enzyme
VRSFNLEELPGWALALLTEARVGHLGLLDEHDRPRVLPVTFALHDGAVWSAVDRKPKRVEGEELARVRWLRRRPEASLTVDRYDDDWTRLAWVQLVGRAEVMRVDAAPAALEALAEKYEPYQEERPPGPLIRLSPERAVAWRAREPAGHPRAV